MHKLGRGVAAIALMAMSVSWTAMAATTVTTTGVTTLPALNSRGAGPGFAPGEPAPGGRGGFGIATFIAGLGGTTPSNSLLRFVNEDRSAGAVTLTLYDAVTGTQLATWTSASIPAGAGLQVSMASVVAAATPALTSAQQASVLNASVVAAFRGDYQLLSIANSAIVNQSTCNSDSHLGYVEGPGASGISGAVRLTNATTTAGTITADIYDAATGTKLGAWTSASVPAHASITVTASTLGAATSPAVPTTTAALTIVPTGATARLRIEHLAAVTGQTTASNLSAACPL